jgi:hypothetical protein
LKELLNEFHVAAEEIKKKTGNNDEKIRVQKALGEK